MKELESLKSKFEDFYEVKFVSLCGRTSGDYYIPTPVHNPKSTKYWLRFFQNAKGDFATMGDFSDSDKKLTLEVTFSIQKLSKLSDDPDPVEYKKELAQLHKNIKFSLSKMDKGLGSYLSEFKKAPECTVYSDGTNQKVYVPYKNLYTGMYSGILTISTTGRKLWMKGCEPNGSYHMIKKPKEKAIVYLCEGIRTAYAVALGCEKGHGVISVGSLSNMKRAIVAFKDKGYKVVLCSEKSGYAKYVDYRYQFGVLLVGSREHEDVYDYYKETDINCLATLLLSFSEKSFIPMGLVGADRLQIYLKSRGDVVEYKKSEAEQLMADCEDLGEAPSQKAVKNFYWRARNACRLRGKNEGYAPIKEGIFPMGNAFVFFDRKVLYLLRENGAIQKLDVLNHITTDSVFIKSDFAHFHDYSTLDCITPQELNKMFSYLKMFNLKMFEQKLMFGWIFQSLLCGGVEHRTPIWIHGKSFSGKSCLSSKYLMNCFLYSIKAFGRNTTPRFLVRSVNGKACPVHRDEMEPNKFKHNDTLEEMEYIRETVTDRFPQRGIAKSTETTTIFTFCFSALLTSIKVPFGLTAADLARIIFFKMERKEDANFQKKIAEFERFMTPLRKARLLKYALTKLHLVRKAYQEFSTNPNFIREVSHKRSSILSLAACYNTCMEDDISLAELESAISTQRDAVYTSVTSRKLQELLHCVLDSYAFSLDRAYTLLEAVELIDQEPFNDILGRQGIYVRKRGEKEILCISVKKGISFARRLLKKDDKSKDMELEDLNAILANDGDYLIKANLEIKSGGVKRGIYHCFDLDLVKKTLVG